MKEESVNFKPLSFKVISNTMRKAAASRYSQSSSVRLAGPKSQKSQATQIPVISVSF